MPIKKALGNEMWELLHCLAMIAKERNQVSDYQWFEKSMIVLMPCEKCRSHYKSHTSKPEYVELADPVAKINYVHNKVNKSLGKKQFSVKDSIKHYQEAAKNNKRLLKLLTRVLLTLSNHWNRTRWNKGNDLGKTKHLHRIARFGYSILDRSNDVPPHQLIKAKTWATETNAKEIPKAPTVGEVVAGWMQTPDFYKTKVIYQMLDETGFTFSLKADFSHDTKGCDCHNK